MSDVPPPEEQPAGFLARSARNVAQGATTLAQGVGAFVTEITPSLPLLPNAPSAFKAPLSDVDDVFGTLPDVDEVFALPKPWYSKSPALSHFAAEYSRVWDHAMSTTAIPGQPDPTRKALQDAGVFAPADARMRTITQQFNEMMYQALMASQATIMGAAGLAAEVGVPREVVGAALEVFPAGRMTGLPRVAGAPLGAPSPAMGRLLPRGAPLDLDVAADLGVFGRRSSDLTASERFAPNADVSLTVQGRTSEAPIVGEPVAVQGEAPGAFPRPNEPAAVAGDPPVAPGNVRFYHGGSHPGETGGTRWVQEDRAYAEGWARNVNGDVFYVDVPETRLAELGATKTFDDTGTSQRAPYAAFDLPNDLARQLKPVTPRVSGTPREVAAALDPPLFEAYDNFAAMKVEQLRLIEEEAEARRSHPTAVAAQQYIDQTLAKVGGVESRLTNAQRQRVAETRDVLYSYLHEDTPAMAFLRQRMQEADEGLRTLGPQVRSAIHDATEAAHGPEPTVVAPRGIQTTINRLPGGGFEVVVDTPEGVGRLAAVTPEAAVAQEARLKAAYAQRQAILSAKTDAEAGKPLPYRVNNAGNVSVIMDGERVRLNLTGEERSILRNAEQRRNASVRAEDVARYDADVQTMLRRGVERLRAEALPLRLEAKPGIAAAAARLERELVSVGILSTSDIQRDFVVGFTEANRIRDRMIAKNADKLRTLYQRNGTISTDMARKLVLAGRPEAEAKAAARILQSMYEAHAARFKGELGSAWDIYQREGPNVRGPGQRGRVVTEGITLEQPARGKISLADPSDPRAARSLITFFKNADASTFMHETAHDWLERLLRDATHSKAPQQLIDDVAAVREWIGMREGEKLSPEDWTRAHEQFATAFERYLLEGTAPSKGLARVFQQFKEWLTSIYQGGISAGVPINDRIRQVFDRMLVPEREPIIAPERPPPRDPVAEARATPPHLAGQKADEVLAEREAASGQLRAEIVSGRRDARSRPERTRVSDGGVEDPKAVFRREAGIGPDDNVGEGRTVSSRKSETPTETGDGYGPADRPLIDYQGNIRVENIETADDVRQVIIDASGERTGFMEARRNVLTDAETIRLAEERGVDPKTIDKWEVGQAWTAEQVIWARTVLRNSATYVRDLALRVATTTDEATLLDYVQARQTHMMIQEAVSGATAEAGRALRAFRFLRAEGDLAELNRFLKLDGSKDLTELRNEARELSQLAMPEQINKLLTRARHIQWSKMGTEAWINALVSGPHTHLVNTGTNAGVMLGAPIEAGVAAAVGRVFRLFGREQGVTAAEIIDRAHGISMGFVDGLRGAGAILRDESKIDIYNPLDYDTRTIPGIVGQGIRLPGRFLAAEDKFFKAVAWQQEINVQARRIALSEGLSGDVLASRIEQLRGTPTPEMIAEAVKFERYQTFQTALGRRAQWLYGLAGAHPLMRLVLPFIRTPVNLLKYSIERGPLGLLSKQVWENMTGKNGAAARDTQISRMLVGNMVGIGVGYMALNGLITGGGPLKDEEQMTLRMTGWQPYSVRIGDISVSYRRFDPFSNTIGVAADLASLAKYWVSERDEFGRDFEVNRFTTLAGMTIYRNMIDKLSLRGVTGLVEATIDYERHGKSFINGLVGSSVPGVVGQTARALDPFERETRSAWEAFQARLPWMREDLMPKRDRWGEPFIAGAIGPLQLKMVNEDPVNRTLLELGVNVDQPRRQIGGVDLTSRQYDDYTRISGRLAKTMLDGIISPQFRSMPSSAQIDTIKSIVNQARAMARAEVGIGSLGTEDDIIEKGLDLRLRVLETGH